LTIALSLECIRHFIMNQFILLIGLLIFCQDANGQKIVIPEKRWEGLYESNPHNYFQAEFRSSSKWIDGNEYYELMYKVDDGWFEGVRHYFREEDEKVYRLVDGEEKIVLDFGLAVGDTIELTDDFGSRFKFFPIRVVDTIIYNKVLRKMNMRIKPENEDVSNVPHVWIEGVGDTGFFFDAEHVFGNQNSSSVFCVRENGAFYSSGMMCPELVSSSDLPENDKIEFRYEPNTKMIFLEDESIISLKIYSVLGERIFSLSNLEYTREVDLSTIHSAMCVIVFENKNGFRSTILKL